MQVLMTVITYLSPDGTNTLGDKYSFHVVIGY